MSLSKRLETEYNHPDRKEIRFHPEELGKKMQYALPEVQFAFLLGSAGRGTIPRYGDLDIAVFLENDSVTDFDTVNKIMKCVENIIGKGVDVDPGILNNAGVVYRFKALQGKRLFVRPEAQEKYIQFFIQTSKEYEDYMFRMKRYRKNRKQVKERAEG